MKKSPFIVVAGILFLVVVACSCVFSLQGFVVGDPPDIQQIVTASIGILGVVFYLCKFRGYPLFLYAWILMQVVIIDKVAGGQPEKFIDFHLLLDYGVSFEHSFRGVLYNIGLNFVPLVFIPFMFTLKHKETLIGEEFMLKQYRENDFFQNNMPQAVKVLDILNFSGNRRWVLIHLSRSITFEDTRYFHALIRAKDYISIRKRREKQIAHFRLFDGHKNPGKELQEFPFVDWVVVE